jgi:hypothetical protein
MDCGVRIHQHGFDRELFRMALLELRIFGEIQRIQKVRTQFWIVFGVDFSTDSVLIVRIWEIGVDVCERILYVRVPVRQHAIERPFCIANLDFERVVCEIVESILTQWVHLTQCDGTNIQTQRVLSPQRRLSQFQTPPDIDQRQRLSDNGVGVLRIIRRREWHGWRGPPDEIPQGLEVLFALSFLRSQFLDYGVELRRYERSAILGFGTRRRLEWLELVGFDRACWTANFECGVENAVAGEELQRRVCIVDKNPYISSSAIFLDHVSANLQPNIGFSQSLHGFQPCAPGSVSGSTKEALMRASWLIAGVSWINGVMGYPVLVAWSSVSSGV